MRLFPISGPLSRVRPFNKLEEINVKYFHVVLVSAIVALVLVGCDGGDGTQTIPAGPPASTSTPIPTTDFQDFVRQLLASTAENTDPVPISGLLFSNQLADGEPQPITFFRP